VEARFSPFGDSANLDKIIARFTLNVPLDHKLFWTHLMKLLGDVGHVECCFDPIRD
jgi:hypothetical protein